MALEFKPVDTTRRWVEFEGRKRSSEAAAGALVTLLVTWAVISSVLAWHYMNESSEQAKALDEMTRAVTAWEQANHECLPTIDKRFPLYECPFETVFRERP